MPMFVKPDGGLWGSPVDATYGWAEWCKETGYEIEKLETSFLFTLAEGANLLRVSSIEDLTELPKQQMNLYFPQEVCDMLYELESLTTRAFLDFEALLASGVDAVQVDTRGAAGYEVRHALNGWDCDSILVLNKDVIIPI